MNNNTEHFRAVPFEIQFQEGAKEVPAKIQVLRVGDFFDDRYGKVSVTPKVLAEMKANFDAKVRKIDIAIDYSHNSEAEAAGWIRSVELSESGDELWAVVEWTEEAARKLSDKQFRYVSADFSFSYTDNETRTKFGSVLLGAGLTNRPVIKGMAPAIALHENRNFKQKGIEMTEQEMLKKIADLEANEKVQKAEIVKLQEGEGEKEDQKSEIKKLQEQVAKLTEENRKLREGAKLAEQTQKFDKLMSEGKAVEAQRESYLAGDMEKFIELSEEVNLEGKGNGGAGNDKDQKDDVEDKVISLAQKKTKEESGLTLDVAIDLVLSENPELNKEYEKRYEV